MSFFPRTAFSVLALLICFGSIASVAAQLPGSGSGALATQTITIYPIADHTLDAAPFQVLAVPDSNLPVTLSVAGPATLSGRLLTLTGTGLVTVTATQAGNTQYVPATATQSFHVLPAPSVVAWTPPSLVYGEPLPASTLNATATAAPLIDLGADTTTISAQLNRSQVTGEEAVSVTTASSALRYEGSTVEADTSAAAPGSVISNGAKSPLGLMYRIAFTCTCSQFEFVLQSGQGSYRVWVDGQWTSIDATDQLRAFPAIAFYRVQFPDRRARQIKVAILGQPPFYGLVTGSGDTVTAPQVPLGERVMIFGDSWTGPTILPPLIGPPQPGLAGSGYPQVLGEYFNWDYWDSGEGGEGFTVLGTDGNGQAFPGRALTDICGRAPAFTIVMGGVNDGNASAQQVEDAAAMMFQELANCLPGVQTAVYGPQIPYASTTMEQGLAAAASQFTSTVTYTDMAGQLWLYGSPFNPATGNAYLYFAAHPTPLGHDYLAEKIAFDLLKKQPELAPKPYTLFAPAPASGSFRYSVAAGALIPAGVQPVSVTFTPQSAGYATVTLKTTLTVAKARTATSVSAVAGQASGTATLTAKVAPQVGGLPTGSVTFSSNGAALATVALNGSSMASYRATNLGRGQDAITALYGGDANFEPSLGRGSVTIPSGAVPGFTFSLSQTQLLLAPNQQGSVTLSITPQGGFTGGIAVHCSGLPAGASCGFAAGAVLAVAGAPTTASLNIQPGSTALSRQSAHTAFGVEIAGVLGFWMLLPGASFARRRWAGAAAVLLGLLSLTGCGVTDLSAAAAGTYTVEVVLVSTANPAITQTQTLTVVIS